MSRTALARWLRILCRSHRADGKTASEARAIARAAINEQPNF